MYQIWYIKFDEKVTDDEIKLLEKVFYGEAHDSFNYERVRIDTIKNMEDNLTRKRTH